MNLTVGKNIYWRKTMFSSKQIKALEGRKVLVTGCSGQLGKRLIVKLASVGAKVSGMDIIPPGEDIKLDFIRCDIRNQSDLKKAGKRLEKMDILIHLASAIKDSKDILNDAVPSIDLNVTGTLNLLEHLPSLRHVCFTSSYMVYGSPGYNPVDELHPTDPQNIYGACKLATEKYLRVWSRGCGSSVGILRLMGVYGPGTPPGGGRAIPRFIEKAMKNEPLVIHGKGRSRRNYVYIDDAVDAIVHAALSPKSGVWNIGGPEAWSVKEIASAIIAFSGSDVEPEYIVAADHELDFICDISRAKKELGFKPETGMKEGLNAEIAHYSTRDAR